MTISGQRRGTVRRAGIVPFVLILVAADPTRAAETGHDPHVHGQSRLNLGVDGKTVEIELEAPGADIVGFETKPRSDVQRARIKDAMATLRDGAKLFRLSPAARCRLVAAEIEPPFGEDHDHERGGEAHSEFHAHYRFRCDRPGRLRDLAVGLFEAFPAMRTIALRAILPGGQRAGELTRRAPKFEF